MIATDNQSPPTLSLGAVKLRAWRQREGLTLTQAATLFGVTQPAVHFWETGKKVPRHGNISKLNDLEVCGPNDWHLPAPVVDEALQSADVTG
tara:strand:- start:814 stop:1089 length:276 start_codon:yes stop_codon:yes gene_type:complete